MIYPYKWEVTSRWHLRYQVWLIGGQFCIGKKIWNTFSYQDDKNDLTEINESIFKFWRKRGAM